MVEKPEISPICGKNPAHAEIRVHKICVFLGRTVHTHGKIKGWGKLLKKKPPPFRITKRVSELFRKTENVVVPFRKRGNTGGLRTINYYNAPVAVCALKEMWKISNSYAILDAETKEQT